MQISKEWLEDKMACSSGIRWFNNQTEKNGLKVVKKLVTEDKLDWANWLIARIMSYKQYVSYAVFAAEQVIDIYEKKHPDDKRPRQAIEAAKKCIENLNEKNKAYTAAYASAASAAYTAAASAASAASAAADVASAASAAYAAYAAAASAASAAYAAADAAAAASAAYAADVAYAAYAAYAADTADAADVADVAADAADTADAAATTTKKETKIKILNYGISLLDKE